MMDPRKTRVISWDAPPSSEGIVPSTHEWTTLKDMMSIHNSEERCKFLKKNMTAIVNACNEYIELNVLSNSNIDIDKQLAGFLTTRQSHYCTRYEWYKKLVLNGEFVAYRLCLNPCVKVSEKLYPLSRNLLCPGSYHSVNTRLNSTKLSQLLSFIGLQGNAKSSIDYKQLEKYRNIIGRWIRPKELAYMHESTGIPFKYFVSVFTVPNNDAAIRKFTSSSIYDTTQKIKCLYIWVRNKNCYGESHHMFKYIHVYTTEIMKTYKNSLAPLMEVIATISGGKDAVFKKSFVGSFPVDTSHMIKDERTIVDV